MHTIAFLLVSFVGSSAFAETSHFACKGQGNSRFRPYFIRVVPGTGTLEDWSQKPKGLLGQNPMTSLVECERAVHAANNEYGIVCSRTGLDGWKPTTFTGTRPGRPDFGYLGGSSILEFEDCLEATDKSSEKGVCYWGGSDWWISAPDKEDTVGGPFRSLSACVAVTAGA